MSPEKTDELSRLLSEGTWTHDHPITYEKAKSFGLPVRADMPPEFLDLMNLYPQPVRHQPAVEYLPEFAAPRAGGREAESQHPHRVALDREPDDLPADQPERVDGGRRDPDQPRAMGSRRCR